MQEVLKRAKYAIYTGSVEEDDDDGGSMYTSTIILAADQIKIDDNLCLHLLLDGDTVAIFHANAWALIRVVDEHREVN